MLCTLLSACFLLPLPVASELPPPVLPHPVGVNIHFSRGHERDLDLIAAAGIKVVRMDFVWASIERKIGEYDWSAYDELTTNLEKRGIRPYYILDYSNALYEETVTSINPINGKEQRDVASPQKPESVEAFAKWAAAGAERYKGRKVIWEIWNEPNISFWKPKPDVAQYTKLALATCKSIRAVDPQALIVGPATSELPLKFLEEFFKSGVLEYLDAVSVHPYRNYSKTPETALEEYEKLRELIRQHAPAQKTSMPILSGEWGYASHNKGVSLETQANFVVRQQLHNLFAGIPVSIWYDWKNDGTNPVEREHNFGLVGNDLSPKPAYIALQTMTRELDGFRVVRKLELQEKDAVVLLLANNSNDQRLAAWSLKDSLQIKLPLNRTGEASVTVINLRGEKASSNVSAGELMLDLTASPQFLSISGARLK